MKLSCQSAQRSGARQVSAMMATARNKELFARSGLLTPEIEAAHPDDLAVSIEAAPGAVETALAVVREMLNQPSPLPELFAEGTQPPALPFFLEEALQTRPDSSIALISVPGEYARYEAANALAAGLDVMLYSDNISLDDEVMLKKLAQRKSLLVMGPDCGTAIIDRVPLGFANHVRRGAVGIIGASGTGIQEVSCLLDRCGLGISAAYGTGSRDLMDEIGGVSAMSALQRLSADADTRLILVIGKMPGPLTRKALAARYKKCGKPVMARYLGVTDHAIEDEAGIGHARSLTDLARMAASLLAPVLDTSELDLPEAPPVPPKPRAGARRPRWLRAVFSGGSFCREATELALPILKGTGGLFANTEIPGATRVAGIMPSREHSFLDMGANEFTVGRPHPLVSPETKLERIVAELCDPETAVVLTDIVLGHGVARNQAPLLIQALDKAAVLSSGRSRHIPVIASVCGTELDEPSRSSQVALLQEAGGIVLGNNAGAAVFAATVCREWGR